jgi:septum formation protein
VPFRVVASEEDEQSDPALPADERVMLHARGKAHEVATRAGMRAGGAVLGADTEVVVDGRALGKPADAADARRMLAGLSGRTHQVMSGVVLVTPDGTDEALAVADVRFRDIDGPLMEWYLGLGEWRGRSGGYAIQGAGAALVDSITGDPTTVIGLPLGDVAALLRARALFPPA